MGIFTRKIRDDQQEVKQSERRMRDDQNAYNMNIMRNRIMRDINIHNNGDVISDVIGGDDDSDVEMEDLERARASDASYNVGDADEAVG